MLHSGKKYLQPFLESELAEENWPKTRKIRKKGTAADICIWNNHETSSIFKSKPEIIDHGVIMSGTTYGEKILITSRNPSHRYPSTISICVCVLKIPVVQ